MQLVRNMKPNQMAQRLPSKDVWGIFSPLSQKHGSVNLGQGFPNIKPAKFVTVLKYNNRIPFLLQ